MIRQATSADIETIRHIACLTWPIAYSDILSPGQLGYMLRNMYNHEALLEQMTEQGHLFFLAEANGKPVGFAGISKENYPTAPPNRNTWKLHKLYVLPTEQKTGTGKKLMQHVIETIKANKGNYLILNVNRKNPAYNYYIKNGFEVIETGDFDIGEGFYMNDYVMGKALS